MAHISTIGATIYSELSVQGGLWTAGDADLEVGTYAGIASRPVDVAAFRAYFEVPNGSDVASNAPAAAANVINVGHIREFPAMGTPANVVNVPQYGQATSSQIRGQSDAPTMEFTLNYVPDEHGKLDIIRKQDIGVVFRVRIANADNVTGKATDIYDDFYFYGKIASLEVTPSLNDAFQATMAVTIDGDFEGPCSETGSGVNTKYGVPGTFFT